MNQHDQNHPQDSVAAQRDAMANCIKRIRGLKIANQELDAIVLDLAAALDAIATRASADVGGLTDEQIEAKFASVYYPPKDPGNELLQRVFPADLVKVARALLATRPALQAAGEPVQVPEWLLSAIKENGDLYSLGHYLIWDKGAESATLDGDFSADDLRAIAAHMDGATSTLPVAAHQAVVPEGFALVPVEPTEKVLDAMHGKIRIHCVPEQREANIQNDREVWAAMLAAAPAPPVSAAEQPIANAVQQAQQWAQEARTQRDTVLSILRYFGLPEHDWEALWLIQDHLARQAQAAPGSVSQADLWKSFVDKAVDVLQRHIVPDGLSDHAALNELYGIFDGPEFRAMGTIPQMDCDARQARAASEDRQVKSLMAIGAPKAAQTLGSVPQAFLAAELEPATPVYKVADVKAAPVQEAEQMASAQAAPADSSESVDTAELRALLNVIAAHGSVSESDVAHITSLIAARVAGVRKDALEEAADKLESMNDSAGDRASYDNREMNLYERERMHALSTASEAIRALIQSPASSSQEGK